MRHPILAVVSLALLASAAPAQKPTEFTVETDDGYVLKGELQLPRLRKDEKAPLAFFIHDAEGKRDTFAEVARRFTQSGFASVLFDLRGHGDSAKKTDGRKVELDEDLWKLCRRDVSAVLRWCAEQPSIDMGNIAIVGAGFGATQALKAASTDAAMKAVVVLSPYLSDPKSKDDNAKYVERIGERALLFITGRFEEDKKNTENLEYYAKAKGTKPELKSVPSDYRGADLLTARSSLAGEIVAWVKKNGIDPKKR